MYTKKDRIDIHTLYEYFSIDHFAKESYRILTIHDIYVLFLFTSRLKK